MKQKITITIERDTEINSVTTWIKHEPPLKELVAQPGGSTLIGIADAAGRVIVKLLQVTNENPPELQKTTVISVDL